MTQALEGIRVLDLSQMATGPFCSMMLADMGAEVIKVEIPKIGDGLRRWGPPFLGGESVYFLYLNRNKKSVTLNLKDEKGRKIFLELLKKADILIENFRPGTMEKLDLNYSLIQETNPRVIYCRISGYGQTGPHSSHGGYDILIQGESGLMVVTGELDHPPGAKVGVAIVDFGTGMYAAYGIMLALLNREKTGKGQVVDASLFDSAISWMLQPIGSYMTTGMHPKRLGTVHPAAAPYQAFKTKEGYITIGCADDGHWKKLCEVLHVEQLVDDSRFATNPRRVENREELISTLNEIFVDKKSEEWLNEMLAVGIPCAPVNTFDKIVSDPQLLHRQMFVEMSHPTAGRITLVGIPIKLSETPGKIASPPPLLGQDTDHILRDIGYNDKDIERLREQGVI
jgi:formyl-CoA transferase/CoA:oxalate CoA-transferase